MRSLPWLEKVFYLALLYFLLLEFLVTELQNVWALKLGLYLATGFMLLYLLTWLPQWLRRVRQHSRAAMSLALSLISPPILATGFLQLMGGFVALARYRFRPPTAEAYRQKVSYTLPFKGTWWVANGGPDASTSHSWDLVGQRYAYDFVITDDGGKSYRHDGRQVEDYYAFGAPVLAPADGIVVAIQNRHRDCPWPGIIDPLAWSILGNYVLIRHADSEYSLLAHLRRGSLRVRPGDRVLRGQMLGECGNSGHSTEPHLHFQVQDHPNFFLAASLPVRYERWCRVKEGHCQQMEEGLLVRGEHVANCESAPDHPRFAR
jgi:murein DD-endopeptidase MepM/ murein hydrolase activator NlpD